jgi:hypothetical protein
MNEPRCQCGHYKINHGDWIGDCRIAGCECALFNQVGSASVSANSGIVRPMTQESSSQPDPIAPLRAEDDDAITRLKEPDIAPPCNMCHGPYQFDTTIPSPIWNRVVRAQNLPEYLCLTCIVKVFAKDSQSFTAQLWGDDFNGTPIEVRVAYRAANSVAALEHENNELRLKIAQMESTIAVLTTPEVVKLAQGLDDIRRGRIVPLPDPPSVLTSRQEDETR